MPQDQTYEVTAPDGRTVEIAGSRMPTEVELKGIFEKLPKSSVAKPSSDFQQQLDASRARIKAHKENPPSEPLRDVAVGAARGAVSTVQGLASPIRKVFGMPAATPPPEETTMAGKIGRGAEQIAEFAVPAGMAERATKGLGLAVRSGAQAATAFGVSKAQGSSTTGAVVNAGLSGISPVVSTALKTVGPAIKERAIKELSRVFATGLENRGPMVDYALKTGDAGTKDIAKAAEIVRTAASDTLNLPIRASWGKWQTLLAKDTEAKGQALGAALKGPFGQTPLPKADIVKALDDLKSASAEHFAQISRGGYRNVPFDEPLLKEIETVKKTLEQYDNTITAKNLVDIKRVWDDAVYNLSTVGKVGVSPEVLVSNAMKEARFTGANAIRDVLKTGVPEIAALDQAVSHAIRLQDLTAKLYKANPAISKSAQTILTSVPTSAGAVIGHQTGGGYAGAILGASVGGTAARAVIKAMESPAWQTAKPFLIDRLADAIASGSGEQVVKATLPILQQRVSSASQ